MSNILKRSDNLVVFQANGEYFVDGFDLHTIERLLPEYRRLLDVAHHQITSQPAFYKRKRLISHKSKIEEDCFDVIVDFAFKVAPLSLAALGTTEGRRHLQACHSS